MRRLKARLFRGHFILAHPPSRGRTFITAGYTAGNFITVFTVRYSEPGHDTIVIDGNSAECSYVFRRDVLMGAGVEILIICFMGDVGSVQVFHGGRNLMIAER